MRSFWAQVPMLKITLAVIAGIGIEIYTDTQLHLSKEILLPVLILGCVSAVLIITIGLLNKTETIYRLRVLHGTVLTVLLISFGFTLTWFYAEKNYRAHFENYLEEETFLIAEIVNPPLDKEKVVTAIVRVREVKGSFSYQTSGKLLINLLRDSLSGDLKYGDVIAFKSEIEEFDEPKNPNEFSFKLYQSFHNIYHRTFLKPGDWKLINQQEGNLFMSAVYAMREYFLSLITKYVRGKNDFAVASAIMLGYNDYMNGDVTRAYASSGALHVLSVSGLHVGIMFFMLNMLLKWMDKMGRRYQIAKSVIVILLIWLYACLTGLSPSVLRSAAMFSLIQVGIVLTQNVNIYNVIFGSALVLILFNPFIVTEVGFRLSYLAVIGIIYLQPKFYSILTFKNWFLDKAWMIIAVSLAAQIATCPLSLFYFHQFPTMFLLSNLVVIPVSNFVLFSGTALFALGEVPYINFAIGWCFDMLIWLLNKFIFVIDSLPFALIQGISITMIEMILIYILVVLICWLTEERRVKVLIASLFIVLGLSSFYSYEQIIKPDQKKIVVYSVPKQRAIAFIDGRKVYYAFDSTILQNHSSMLFHVRHHWWDCGIQEEITANSKRLSFGNLILLSGKKVLLIDSTLSKPDFELPEKLKVDLVILSHSPKVYMSNLIKLADFQEVVFDSSNKKWRIDYWKKDCAKMKIKFWDVNEQGAFIRDV